MDNRPKDQRRLSESLILWIARWYVPNNHLTNESIVIVNSLRFRNGLEPFVERIKEVVEDHHVDRFHDAHVERGHVEAVVAHLLELSTVVTRDAHCRKAVCIGPLDCLEDVWTVSRAADREQDCTRVCKVLQLLDEDTVVAQIVSVREDARRVVSQAHHLEPFLLVKVMERPLPQVLTEVRSVRARPAVPDDEYEPIVLVRLRQEVDQCLDLCKVDLLK